MSCGDIFLALIAVLFPPIAVWIKSGLCSADSLINICLCCLGYLPGLIHAWYIIARHPEQDYDYQPLENERGERVTYYYVSHSGNASTNRNYGTQGQQPKPVQPPQQSGVVASGGNAAGPSSGQAAPPPSYTDAVKGDHKIQTQD